MRSFVLCFLNHCSLKIQPWAFFYLLRMSDVLHFPGLAVFSGAWVKLNAELNEREEGGCPGDAGLGGWSCCCGDVSPSQGSRGRQAPREGVLQGAAPRLSPLHRYHASVLEIKTYLLVGKEGGVGQHLAI